MNQTILDRMKAMAVLENKRLRQITGNIPSHSQMKAIKEAAAKGGYNSHASGNKKGKNGNQQREP